MSNKSTWRFTKTIPLMTKIMTKHHIRVSSNNCSACLIRFSSLLMILVRLENEKGSERQITLRQKLQKKLYWRKYKTIILSLLTWTCESFLRTNKNRIWNYFRKITLSKFLHANAMQYQYVNMMRWCEWECQYKANVISYLI